MAVKALPSPEVLRQLLRYEPETGNLYWLPRTPDMFTDGNRSAEWQCRAWNAKRANLPALHSINDSGYRRGNIGGRSVRAHRAAWALAHGAWPEHEIDHINGVPSDNRLCNLRLATSSENKMNRAGSSKRSRFIGVSPNPPGWTASVRVNGKYLYGGYFSSDLDAAIARDALALEHYGPFARLNFPNGKPGQRP